MRGGFRPSCSEPTLGRSLSASTASWSSYLGWSRARPGQGGGSRPPTAACRPGTSGSSPASGPSLLLCRPGTLVDTCREEVQDWQEVGRRPEKSQQCKKPSESGTGFHYGRGSLQWPLVELLPGGELLTVGFTVRGPCPSLSRGSPTVFLKGRAATAVWSRRRKVNALRMLQRRWEEE